MFFALTGHPTETASAAGAAGADREDRGGGGPGKSDSNLKVVRS